MTRLQHIFYSCAFFLLAFVAGVTAQERPVPQTSPLVPRQWILTLQGSATKGFDDFPDTRFSGGGAFLLKRHLLDISGGRRGLLYAQAGLGFYDMQFKTSADMYRVFDTSRLEMHETNRSFIMPLSFSAHWRGTIGPRSQVFLGAGLEALYFSPMNPNGDALERPQEKYGKWTLGIPLSVELEYLLSDDLALNLHGTMHQSFTDYLDGFSQGGWSDALLVFGIGVSYSFPPADRDRDYDGLLDRDEIHVYRTNPDNSDTDGDGLNDGEEVVLGTSPLRADTDGDGLNDGDEVRVYGTEPLRKDSDGDGLTDMEEIRLGSSPTRADTDNDGLPDAVELARGTDPLSRDTDGDGLPDGLEVVSSPLLRDTDSDGLDDALESAHSLRPHDSDFDADGIPDFLEIQIGTDPKKPDTDNDGATDYAEYYGLMTDPRTPDTDGDGILDGYDPSPLGSSGVNPVQRVYWTLSEVFLPGQTVDETSKSFLLLLHLIRSAPRQQVSELEIEVLGRDMTEARERLDQLRTFLRRLTNGWDIPSMTFIEDVESRGLLDVRIRYIWNRSLGK
ncbi:MAG: hypothetical protein M5R41_15660 [Bacteroidia bacterium]|nr:hypothetical protein [Bacteroidia bacterium]